MSIVTRPRPAVKASRQVRVLTRLDTAGTNGEIEITMTRGRKVETARYWVDRLAADFGAGFLVEKQGDGTDLNEEYHVNLDAGTYSCECKGYLRWNHCKHGDSLAKLTELGKL